MPELKVFINGNQVINYVGSDRLPGKQREFLNHMDTDMDSGFELNDEYVPHPDQMQRARYVAMNLIVAIQNDNESLVAATCAYLKNRLPELRQVNATDDGEQVSLEMLFTESA